MLNNTRSAFGRMVDDVKKFAYRFSLATQIMYAAYLVYAICTGAGILWLNIILLALSVAYFIFYIVTYDNKERAVRAARKAAKRVHRWCKIIGRALTLGVMIYGIYATAKRVTPFSVIIVALMVVAWTLQVLFALVIRFLEKQKDIIVDALKSDFEPIIRPAKAVGGFFKRFKRGKNDEVEVDDDDYVLK